MARRIVTEVMGLPIYFNSLLLKRCANNPKATTMTRSQFTKVWKELEGESLQWKAFWLLSSDPRKKYLTIDDFKIIFEEILALHPGL